MACLEHDRFIQMFHENDNESLVLDGRPSPIGTVHGTAETLES